MTDAAQVKATIDSIEKAHREAQKTLRQASVELTKVMKEFRSASKPEKEKQKPQ